MCATAKSGPVLVHVVTQKGKGYPPAETSADKYHGVVAFDVATGMQTKSKAAAPSYTKVFAESLIAEARKDDKIVAITAAMPSGTGLDLFGKAFPDRTFDVGIAEQHAVTFAGGLATEGFKPFAVIYSTFLHAPTTSGPRTLPFSGCRCVCHGPGRPGRRDGPTHAGAFDVAYLGCLPGFVLMAAADEADLVHMVATQVAIDDRPSGLRYPRGEGLGVPMRAKANRSKLAAAASCAKATRSRCFATARVLASAEGGRRTGGLRPVDDGGRCAVCKALDTDLVLRLAREHEVMITIEEGSIGGFGAYVCRPWLRPARSTAALSFAPWCCPTSSSIRTRPTHVRQGGLDAKGIVAKVFEALGKDAIRRGREARVGPFVMPTLAPRPRLNARRRNISRHSSHARSRKRAGSSGPAHHGGLGRNTGARWVFGGVRKPLIERYILGYFVLPKMARTVPG